MAKSAVVIGATGLVGKALVRALLASDDIKSVNALSRRPLDFEHAKLNNVIVDFEVLENYRDQFRADYLFCCLGTTKKQVGTLEAQRKVDVDYQYRSAKIAKDQGVQHCLVVSSSGANPNSLSPYLKMKGDLERLITALNFEKLSIVQPSVLHGPREDSRLGESLAVKLLGAASWIPGVSRYRPISGDQVAAKLLAVALGQDKTRQVYRLEQLFEN